MGYKLSHSRASAALAFTPKDVEGKTIDADANYHQKLGGEGGAGRGEGGVREVRGGGEK